jgi:hypothetical protein
MKCLFVSSASRLEWSWTKQSDSYWLTLFFMMPAWTELEVWYFVYGVWLALPTTSKESTSCVSLLEFSREPFRSFISIASALLLSNPASFPGASWVSFFRSEKNKIWVNAGYIVRLINAVSLWANNLPFKALSLILSLLCLSQSKKLLKNSPFLEEISLDQTNSSLRLKFASSLSRSNLMQ